MHPDKYLFRPSNATIRLLDFIVETISGDPQQLTNLTQSELNWSKGTVTNVVPISYDKNQYYQISIDSGFSRDISVRELHTMNLN